MNEKCAIVIKDKSEEVGRKNAMKDEKSKITAIAIEKMIDFYQGNLRDIEHFLKVWAYAITKLFFCKQKSAEVLDF